HAVGTQPSGEPRRGRQARADGPGVWTGVGRATGHRIPAVGGGEPSGARSIREPVLRRTGPTGGEVAHRSPCAGLDRAPESHATASVDRPTREGRARCKIFSSNESTTTEGERW